MVPEVSETVLSSFHSFYFILLFRSYFHHFIFQLTDLFFCFRYLLLIPSRVFLISIIVLFVSVCLFFNSSRSLLIDSYISPFLFQVFDHLYYHYSEIFFQVVCLFPLHLFGLLCFNLFLHLCVFLCLFIIIISHYQYYYFS